ncbi:MAG: bifunctional trypsin-like peptidase domain-containing/SEL1-like repeat protein [Bryobacterales bacterium]|nr:bifunctional trypsin-like peptidase domain-containing/SEL1-like repeat protein [Bryobacterales bacterium]
MGPATNTRSSALVLTALFAVTLSIVASTSPLAAVDLDHVRGGVWKVWNSTPVKKPGEKKWKVGTAFAIGPRYMATALHVLASHRMRGTPIADLVLRYWHHGHVSPPLRIRRVAAMSAVHDLAIFEIGTDSAHLGLADEAVASGSRGLTAFGYPEAAGKGLRALKQIGNGISVDHQVASQIYMAVNMGDLGGASGGPILNSRGRVVGVLVQSNDNISIAVTVQRLRDLADGRLGVTCAVFASFDGCHAMAMEDLKERARKTDPAAALELWQHYFDGDLKGGYADKVHLLRQAARQGHVLAHTDLALHYAEGDVVEKDYRKADLWMERAAKQNYPPAVYQMGKWYQADGDSRADAFLRNAAAAGFRQKDQYE